MRLMNRVPGNSRSFFMDAQPCMRHRKGSAKLPYTYREPSRIKDRKPSLTRKECEHPFCIWMTLAMAYSLIGFLLIYLQMNDPEPNHGILKCGEPC